MFLRLFVPKDVYVVTYFGYKEREIPKFNVWQVLLENWCQGFILTVVSYFMIYVTL